jgi:hypothetical protein
MTLILEVPLASIAIVLIVLSWKTLQAIKHLDVGKSFWIPALSSGIFFFAGSVVAILSDLGLSFTPYMVEIVAGSRLLALCMLVSGIYMYSRKITRNLVEKFTLPTDAVQAEPETEKESSTFVLERIVKKISRKEPNCNYYFGYLRTMPRDVSIPEECFDCGRVIDCKHSSVKKVENDMNRR